MKMMNRIFSLAVTAALAVGLLAGCGASSTASSTAASSEAVSSVAASSEAASAEASEAKVKAQFTVTDASGEMTSVGVGDIELHDGDSYAFTYTK